MTPDAATPVPSADTASPPGSSPALDRLAAIAMELGAQRLTVEIEAFRQRIAQGRFYVACVGQFKRGKSTLINALVGESVLPTGIVPITAVPTVVEYGDDPTSLIQLASGEARRAPLSDLASYVSEIRNPQNALGVDAIEVRLPSPLLRDGLCLVDTPGLGAVLGGGTATTRAFVPQIDAALVVAGADPPLSEEELALIKAVADHVGEVIVVLNKADRFTDTERREVVEYTERVLSHALRRAIGPILEVSATERLAGTGPTRDWNDLVGRLNALSVQSGRTLVRAALHRGIQRLAAQCGRALDATYAALWRPIEETEERMDRLRNYEGEFAYQWLRLGFGMDAEQNRLAHEAVDRRQRFLDTVLPDARAELELTVAQAPPRTGPALRRRAFDLARQIAIRTVGPWLGQEIAGAEAQYQRFIERGVAQARELLSRSTELQELALGDLSQEFDPVEAIRVPSRVDPTQFQLSPAPPISQLQWWHDLMALTSRPRRAIRREATQELERLIREGAELVESDVNWRLGQSHERLVQSVHELLQDVYETVNHAIGRARSLRTAGHAARDRELSRLEALRQDITALLDDAESKSGPRRGPRAGGATRST